MATQKEIVEFFLQRLMPSHRFSARPMFGEYALYADGKIVALICDDLLFVKIVPASQALKGECECGEPYPGAKPHYIVDDGQVSRMATLPGILFAIAESLPEKKKKAKKSKG